MFLQDYSQDKIPLASSFEQQSFAINLRLIEILRRSPTTQSVQDLLEHILSHISVLTSLSTSQENENYHRHLDISRYQLEILRSSLIDSVNCVPISSNHRSLMLLEIGKVLYQQGFRTLAVNAIREADQLATSSLLSMTCRLEELLLTSSNEDESKKLKSVKAMMGILENENCSENDTQVLSLSLSNNRDSLAPVLQSLCLQSNFAHR